ncbi:MAG: STAS domain-containing protein [Saccharospirillaceae bacterium]|nr:STAS domain-containing protein [Pseudomonadales bacterium]NRB81208.1 STAS domain-containing protein [Saccharospirillaceae bacterium]
MFNLVENDDDFEIKINGDLTIYNAIETHTYFSELECQQNKKYTLNCEDINNIDTSGLQLLVAFKNKVISNQALFELKNIESEVLSKINLLNLKSELFITE